MTGITTSRCPARILGKVVVAMETAGTAAAFSARLQLSLLPDAVEIQQESWR